MPHRVNTKGDIGTAKNSSDSYDADNIYLTEEGWVYRHFKTADKSMWWDEILVAGQVKPDMEIHGVVNDKVTKTNSLKLGTTSPVDYETGDGHFDIEYANLGPKDAPIAHVGDPDMPTEVIELADKTMMPGACYRVPAIVQGVPAGWTGVSDPSMEGEKPPFVGDDYEACNEYNITVTPLPAPGRDSEPRSVVVGEPDGTCDNAPSPPPSPILGCTDPAADNYNSAATQDDGTCTYTATDATPPTVNSSIPVTLNDDNTVSFTVTFTEAADNTTTWEAEVIAPELYASTPTPTVNATANTVTVVMNQPDRGIYNYNASVVELKATTTHSDGGTPATSTVSVPNITRPLPTCSASFEFTGTDGSNMGAVDGPTQSNTVRSILAMYHPDCTVDMRDANLVVTKTGSGDVFNGGVWDVINGTYTLDAPDANNGWSGGLWEDLTLTFTANYYEGYHNNNAVKSMTDSIDLVTSNYALPDAVAVDGYYPLYTSEADANAASSVGTSHSHMLGSQTYYMPDGLNMGTTMWHGTYGSSSGGGSGY